MRESKARVESSNVIELGNISLDLISRTVKRNGKEHELTSREFSILEHLMRHPGQIIAREQLLSRVWSYDHDPESNVVDVYVRYLRKKLGSDAIETVRGVGYRMTANN